MFINTDIQRTLSKRVKFLMISRQNFAFSDFDFVKQLGIYALLEKTKQNLGKTYVYVHN